MTLTPEALAAAVRAGDPVAVRSLLAGAGEPQRRLCVPALDAVRRELAAVEPASAWAVALAGRDTTGALLLARVGVLSGAAAVAAVLTRDDGELRRVRDDVVGVLLDRAPRWLPDLVTRLAERRSDWATTQRWEVVEALRTATGLPRPTGTPYLEETAGRLTWQTGRTGTPLPDLEAALRGDATLRAVVPALLEVPDIGVRLRGRDTDSVRDPLTRRWEPVARPPHETWGGVLAALVAEGLLDRARLLDLVLGTLLRDGQREHHAWFVALLATLAPTPDEVAARVRAYVGLLADGPSFAATAAQKALRALDDAGRLELETLLDASRAALARREKGPAVASLAWLERVARRRPDAVGALALAAAQGLVSERRDVQERTLAALDRLSRGAPLPGDVVDELRALAQDLPPALHPRAAEVLGGAGPAAPERGVDPAVQIPPPPVPSTEPRVRSLADLAEVAAAALESRDLLAVERVADGVAAFAGADPAAFRAALLPLVPRLVPADWPPAVQRDSLAADPLRAVLHTLLTTEPAPPARGIARLLGAARPRRAPWEQLLPQGEPLGARLTEVVARTQAGEARPLLALPALRTGHVDPEAVVAGIERVAAEGAAPWPRDLEQAWLRMPRGPVADGLLDRLARCPGPAAAWLRERLVSGPAPDPGVVLARIPEQVGVRGRRVSTTLPGALVAELLPPGADGPLALRAAAVPSLVQRAAARAWDEPVGNPLAVLLALPSHREVAAAQLVALAVSTEHVLDDDARACLAALPEAAGPTGAATALALVYAAAHTGAAVRTAAVDALEGFALRGGLDSGAAGALLGDLLLDERVKVGRVASTLAEVARGPVPARRLVWELLAAALPAVLPSGRRGVAELVTVAADTAAAVGARGALPGLDTVAGAARSNRLVAESRRLRDVLAA